MAEGQHRQGCIVAIARCLWGRPKQEHRMLNRRSATETIEFENLVTADNRAKAAKSRDQVVTATEKEHVMSGNLDRLVEEQRRLDDERDRELRRQEEALRQEEEAYYAAKREASRKSRQMTTSLEGPATTGDSTNKLSLIDSNVDTESNAMFSVSDVRDEEEDFDQFLESVKARQLSLTNKAPSTAPTAAPPPQTLTLSDEEEIDFGYWEKAALPSDSNKTTKDADLNLL